MVEPPTRESQAHPSIFAFEITYLFEVLRGETVRQRIQNVADAYTHASDTGTPTALFWVHRDEIC